MDSQMLLAVMGIVAVLIFGTLGSIISFYKKVPQGKALVRTGMGGLRVITQGGLVIPIIHKAERMDVSLKSIEISREGKQGLICQDNLRADIRVVFFIRVNNQEEDIATVAQTVGCERASDTELLFSLFEAKFSEALKTIGKRFDFIELYTSREKMKQEVIDIIGTDLNGYVLDDCAIDYLEQTKIEYLDPDNILDAEGIKKIIDLTANQKIQANLIKNDEEKKIKKQDVEKIEAVLILDKQKAEAEERQKREIETLRAREESVTETVVQEERLKAEKAKLHVDEELEIQEKNKEREILVASKNIEKTEALENEKIDREQKLAQTEKDKIVELAVIAKEKSLEEQKRDIQDVIKERIAVQKSVVEEEERIKDTQAFSEAQRVKKVAITLAEQKAEESLMAELKAAEAAKEASKLQAEQKKIEAAADFETSNQKAAAIKTLAEAKVKEQATEGFAEAQVSEAKSLAKEKEALAEAQFIATTSEAQATANRQLGEAEAEVLRKKMIAEAEGMEQKSKSIELEGLAEAKVLEQKALIEAQRIEAEAKAAQHMDGAILELEKFKLQLNQEKDLSLAKFEMQQELTKAQATVMAEAVKSSDIRIVGGETQVYDRIIKSISMGDAVDSFFETSSVATEVKENLLDDSDGKNIIGKVRGYIDQFGISTEDIKNLSVAGLLSKMKVMAQDDQSKTWLDSALLTAEKSGIANVAAGTLLN
ncbi:flotillin family protein [Flammeovirga kamogawensis]|uniref:Flotillin family protein n=1 Tax=Flammeovirga kamogawensis TaxID=373891 RepID=A0ABX8GS64_9BACT|nr:flotillin family protein [Flammeovirga kamogawensis]MBB6464024.1 putative membrane protein YqiK [Flammeovirga kamogawensis]QWG06143.1 flotillin family protein [Flammeovirga kamogawensis]TRX67975.1 flotillin family protein [Flammeovirga kamogawensis]